MEGFKLIKTEFNGIKKIIAVCFNASDDYISYINAVKKAYNLEVNENILIYSGEFLIEPDIFPQFVEQFINSTTFVLNIKRASEEVASVSIPETPTSIADSASSTEQYLVQLPSSSNLVRSISCLGETEFVNFNTNNKIFIAQEYPTLPTTEDIRNLDEVKISLTNFNKSGFLENRDRIKIVKAVVNHTLAKQNNRIITREEFIQLAQSIVDIFPSELTETYYIPFQKGHLAKGKLYDAYNNYRSRLSAAGLINRRPKAETKNEEKNPIHVQTLDEKEQLKSDIKILQSGSADWEVILSKWKSTHTFRYNQLKDTKLPTSEYIANYPVLLKDKSFELFEIDFEILYPNSASIYEWKKYYEQVILRASKLRDTYVKDILNHITVSLEEDEKLSLAFMLIPYLLPSSRRTSKLEVQNSFIAYFENILAADNDSRQVRRVKRPKFDTQPKVYLIGDSSKTVSIGYVDISGHRLKFDNPMKAVEVCFKCIMGMNIKYPKDCAHVWIFIQKLIFSLSTEWDTVIPSVNTLINDLKSSNVL